MTFNFRRLLISVLLGLLPLAAQAQSLEQVQKPAAIEQGQSAVPTTGVVSPAIGNAASQRQRVGPSAAQPQAPGPVQGTERIEFQDFVAQSTGRDLPIFGSDLFTNVPSTFAPVDNIPVTSDYVIGPGDEIMIHAWGQLEIDYSAVVDRTGTINIPKVGTVDVAGIKYQNLQSYLKTAIGRVFRNFDLNVSLGQLRAIQVFVVGQARRPGSYTISSMSTLVNAIFAAGGPSARGSMRAIQLKRGNQVVTELDLYDLLINGDKSKDARLLPGDVIYIPPVGPLVAITGSVNVPAIFELKPTPTEPQPTTHDPRPTTSTGGPALRAPATNDLSDLIAWAGGLASTASGQKATVERIDDHKTLKVAEFKLDAPGMQTRLHDGDLVTIYSVASRIENAVTLRGDVAQPARFPWRPGMRVKDLIPNSDALISRHYWLRKNQTVGLNNTVAELPRRTPPRDVSPVLAQNAPVGLGVGQGLEARPEEKTRIKSVDEIKRNLDEVNWDYAVIERMNPKDLSTTLVPFNLGKAILENDPTQNLLLQPGDVVTVFSVDDVQVPIAKQTKYVRLEGEFANPGVYSVEPGETLRQLVARVGGLSPNAYLFGAELTRESNRVYQQKKLDEAVNRLQREIQSSAVSAAKNATTADETTAAAQQAQAQQVLVAGLRNVKATGRIVLEVPPDETDGLKDLPNITLEDSDRFIVPSIPSVVNVVGAVYNENAFVYKPGKRLTDYLRQAGGVSRTGDKADVYLLRADGSVVSKRQSGWLMSSFDGERIMPGDTIVVPEDFERTSWTKVLKDYGTILYQFGLGAAAIKVLKQ